MAAPVVCRKCAARLKLPLGCTKKKARCPKCDARIDLTGVRNASAYLPAKTSHEIESTPEPLPLDHPTPPPLPADPSSTTPALDEVLSLDDDPAPPGPPRSEPFRISARVAADSAKLFTGPCVAVLVEHGLFLEIVPYRPFLYIPVHSRVESPDAGMLAIEFPDGRMMTVELTVRDARRLAADTAAYLSGRRNVPIEREYRALPVRAIALGVLLVAAGLAVGLSAYLVERNRLAAQAHTNQPPEEPPPKPPPPATPEPAPPEPPRRPPTAIDRVRAEGVFRFEDGPDEVTALAATGDVLIVGYRNGTSRVWRFDQPAFEPFTNGPSCDGAPNDIQFDTSGSIVYLIGAGGVVAANWSNPPDRPLKIPGDSIALFPSARGDQFAAVRGKAVSLRYVPIGLVRKPPARADKGFPLSAPRDETIPIGVKAMLAAPPQRPTCFAWHTTGKLLAGQPDGSVISWGSTGPGYTVVSREHKAPVRAWAASSSTWDFATGDDKGVVGLWTGKEMKVQTFPAAAAAITQLAFDPSGAILAVADAAGGIGLWDLYELRQVQRFDRSAPVRSIAFGPDDDLLLISSDRSVDLLHLPSLVK